MHPLIRAARAVLPRVGARRRNAAVPESAAPADIIEGPAAEWWANNGYTHVPRQRRLRWLGLDIPLPFTSFNSIKDTYLRPANDVVDLLEAMVKAGAIPPLNSKSSVLEPGCNLGRNLLAIHRRYGCRVTGMDISPEAIRLAREEVWQEVEHATFHLGNVLTTPFFRDTPDAHYDLVLSRAHLTHLAISDAKREYVRHLKRIAKSLVIIEPFPPDGRPGTRFYHEGSYILSYDDWQAEYGLTPFPDVSTLDDQTMAVHYYRAPL